MKEVYIIGNGVAGSTLALNLSATDSFRVHLISDESDFFYSRTALMYLYMGHLTAQQTEPYERNHWEKSGVNRIRGRVFALDRNAKTLAYRDVEGNTHQKTYDILVLAMGSLPRFLDWPNSTLKGVSGLYHLKDLEAIEAYTESTKCKEAVIIGGGLIGVELAEMVHSRGIHTTMVIREPHFWSSVLPDSDAQLVQKHIEAQGIHILTESEVSRFSSADGQHLSGVQLNSGKELRAQFAGVCIGVTPNTRFLSESGLTLNEGVVVDEYLQTSDPSIYAIGDCAELKHPNAERRAVEAVWYVARQMAETLSKHLIEGATAYEQKHWFNSAKFFDLEYQTYGQVSTSSKRKNSEQHFHWHSKNQYKGITLSYSAHDRQFLGVNTFGIRLKQSVFEQWLNASESVDTVVAQLDRAHFDPEFSKMYYNDFRYAFLSNNC